MSQENADTDVKTEVVNGFAPNDLTDGRKQGEWKSRYDEGALKSICWEKKYLIIIFSIYIVLPLIFGILFNLFSEQTTISLVNIKKYFFAWCGGTLGGVMFSAKWLIHTIAKNTWNQDRQLWRILTPHLSAALALVFIILINSEMLNITKAENLTIHKCFGIGFLVGYFSDNAIGKLTELAQVVFGSGMSNKK